MEGTVKVVYRKTLKKKDKEKTLKVELGDYEALHDKTATGV